MENQKKSSLLSKEEILSFLRANKSYLHEQFGVTKIAIFGSYARDEQTETSDIDVAIESTDHSFRTHCHLKDFLEANLKKTVDLCYFDGMRSFIRDAIRQELIYA